jgi:hypothetical protein
MFKQLHEDGYYIGNVADHGIDLEEFDKFCDITDTLDTSNDAIFDVVLSVIPKDPDVPFSSNRSRLAELESIIKEKNLHLWQKWYRLSSGDHMLKPFFRNTILKFVMDAYPEISPEKKNIFFNDSITLYEDGNFINPHSDGNDNKGRLCVVLMYLSKKGNWTEENGGEFLIGEKNIAVPPVRGTYIMLDFASHDLEHAVNMVKGAFKRFTYISFVYNTDKMNKDDHYEIQY